jgi:hypothetical protein
LSGNPTNQELRQEIGANLQGWAMQKGVNAQLRVGRDGLRKKNHPSFAGQNGYNNNDD